MSYIYKGAIHIHTKLSDGTGDLKTIVKAVKQAGLDWIIITDHNHYDTDEGIIDGIYVIKGQEISPKSCNHYLTFGINETLEENDNPQIYVDKVRELGGFGFAAHPDEGNTIDNDGNICPRKNSHHCIPWMDKSVKPDGVEIWNWFSNWADNLDDSSLLTLAYAYIFKHKIITPPSKLTLKWWDELNNEEANIVPAIGGVDAHALKFYRYIVPVTVFPYKTCFKTITNLINLPQKLSEDFNTAKEQILNAIKYGQNTIVNFNICKDIPEIYVQNDNGIYLCGNNVRLDNNCYLHFKSNDIKEVCLLYNGNELRKYTSDKFSYQITKTGKYRLEVRSKGKGYLYTNPFNIKD